jgi:hypothetical protein
MTQPDPSAELTETTPPAEPEETKPTPFDPDSLSPEAKAYIKAQIEGEKFKARDGARKTAADEARKATLAEVAKALGLTEEGEEVSAEEMSGRIQEAQAQAFQARIESQMTRAAGRLGFDADNAMDSNRFMDDLAAALDEKADDSPEHIANLDPRSSAFTAEVERALGVALEKNPRFKTTSTPRADPSQGARGAGPDVDSRIAEAQNKGDWRTVISLQNQKLKF